MTVPNLPTDNLYKFMALTGTILFVAALFYPRHKSESIDLKIDKYIVEIKKQQLEMDAAESLMKEIELEINTRSTSRESDSIIDRLTLELKEVSNRIELNEIEIEDKDQIIQREESKLNVLSFFSGILASISVSIVIAGFTLWYKKTQQIQDDLLKQQLNPKFINHTCQSCGVVFRNNSTKNDEINIDYCDTCFDGNEFTEPDLTLKTMKKRVTNRCKEIEMGKVRTFIFTRSLKNLDRWRRKFSW